jgi:signal transduction histidine kinase
MKGALYTGFFFCQEILTHILFTNNLIVNFKTMIPENTISNNAFIAIYADTQDHVITRSVQASHYKVLAPTDEKTLVQASQNASLVFIGVTPDTQSGILEMITRLQKTCATFERFCAVISSEQSYDKMEILTSGFAYCLTHQNLKSESFHDFLKLRINSGNKNLSEGILQNECLRLEDTMSYSPQATLIFDSEKRIVFASDHYSKDYPQGANALNKGLSVHDAFELMSREDGIFEDHTDYKRLQNLWFNLEGEEEFTFPNGVSYRIQAARLPENRGVIVTTTNITNYIHQQEQLKKNSKALEGALQKEKKSSSIQKQFIDMVSHEFKTPMTIIDGNAQIIARRFDELEPEQIVRRAKTIQSAVKRLTSMVDGILSSSMLETGSMNVTPQEFDIRTMIKGMIIDHTSFSENLKLKYNLDSLPDLVFLDPKLMTLILTNLLSNAVKFAGDDPLIRVETDCDDINFSISVIDNGIGIPDSEHDQIFDRYYRAKNTSGVAGTGIGLSLTKELVEKQNGIMTVKNNPENGACFTITFPNQYNTKQRVGFL